MVKRVYLRFQDFPSPIVVKRVGYLQFQDFPSPTGKTKIVSVTKAADGGQLGEIKWFGRWRQYTFFPAPGTIFNKVCMKDIIAEIDRLMDERKATNKRTGVQP